MTAGCAFRAFRHGTMRLGPVSPAGLTNTRITSTIPQQIVFLKLVVE